MKASLWEEWKSYRAKRKLAKQQKKQQKLDLPEGGEALEDQVNGMVEKGEVDKLAYLADYLNRLNLADYVRMTQRPKRLIGFNFLAGVARGFGMAVGFTVLGALGFIILNRLNVLNLPVIGDLIAQIMEYVELARSMRI